jgi:lipopolysaccharide transport system permease protein
LVSLLVWIIVKQGGIINPGELAVPYPAFVFLSITMWALFFEIYKRTGNTILENTNLMLANKIPFEVFILNNILEGIIRVSISFLLCIFLFLFLGVKVSYYAILFPVLFLPLVMAGLFLGLLSCLFRIVAVDLGNILEEVIKLLFFCTPVLYTLDKGKGMLSKIILFNPLSYLIEVPRAIILEGESEYLNTYLILSFGLFIGVLFLFKFCVKSSSSLLERAVNQ